MSRSRSKDDTLIIWEDPYISANNMSEFIRQMSSKHKQNIWSQHSHDGYIDTLNLTDTLHSFTTLCMKMQHFDDISTPPTRDEMEDNLKPLCEIIARNIADHTHGIDRTEYNTKLHEWILDTDSYSVKSRNAPKTRRRRLRKPPKSKRNPKSKNSKKSRKRSESNYDAPISTKYELKLKRSESEYDRMPNNPISPKYGLNVAPSTDSRRKIKEQEPLRLIHSMSMTNGHYDDHSNISAEVPMEMMVNPNPNQFSPRSRSRSRSKSKSKKRKPKPSRSRKRRKRDNTERNESNPLNYNDELDHMIHSKSNDHIEAMKEMNRIEEPQTITLALNPSPSTGSNAPLQLLRVDTQPIEDSSHRLELKMIRSNPVDQKKTKGIHSISKSADRVRGPRRTKPPRTRRKVKSTVSLGQTVRLVENRVGYVRFKGKVKFSIGEWYGIEIFDINGKTRHNGLFVKREQIVEVIKPQDIKRVLKELEREQLRQQRAERQKAVEKKRKKKETAPEMENVLALYQQEIYGNDQLSLRAANSGDDTVAKKHFRRFSRLSSHSIRSPSITLLVDQEALFGDESDDEGGKETSPALSLVPNATEFGGAEDMEYFQEIFSNDDDGIFEIKLFGAFGQYVSAYNMVMNKGIKVQRLNLESKEGRAFVLEYGTGENEDWFIEQIDGRNIKKMTAEKVARILERATYNVEKGYTILLKQCQ